MKSYILWFSLLIFFGSPGGTLSQVHIPGSYTNLQYDDQGRLVLHYKGLHVYPQQPEPGYALDDVMPRVEGTQTGLLFHFSEDFSGTLVYGFVKYGDGRYPMPVFRKDDIPIRQGRAFVDFGNLRGSQDMIDWERTGRGTIGYRVLDDEGTILFDGKTAFTGNGPFESVNAIWEGPLVQNMTRTGCVISFRTTLPSVCTVTVEGITYGDSLPTRLHEMQIRGLDPGKLYEYTVGYGNGFEQKFSFSTPPEFGSRAPFTFAYLSDSRNGGGGGERNIYGLNAYTMKKIMAVCAQNDARFLQFTGDMINGHQHLGDELLQYANWKIALTPFWHYMPIYAGMGNHEKFVFEFAMPSQGKTYNIDRFPYASQSAEAVFGDQFILPENGPVSEDGSKYDPVPGQQDFPPYRENVYSYRYDNVAMIVLNTHYWYSSKIDADTPVGGNPHGYIMDNQLQWLREIVGQLEMDPSVDHIFVTTHTPVLPNSGHVKDGMWHNGNNDVRPVIGGRPVARGVLQRRDEYLDVLINESHKTVALLTGDEHNYCRTEIGPLTPMYPQGYTGEKLKLKRSIYQINNGSAGAPYQAQVDVPWSDYTRSFTTQYAVCLFDIEGRGASMRVVNPDTLEEIDRVTLR